MGCGASPVSRCSASEKVAAALAICANIPRRLLEEYIEKAEEEREQRGKDAEAKKRTEARKRPTTPDESSIRVNKNGFYMRELRNNGTMSKEVTCKKNEQTGKYELSETIVTVLNGETSVNTKSLQLTRAQFNELMAKAREGAKLQLSQHSEHSEKRL